MLRMHTFVDELYPFPSSHTCVVANVLAVESLLREGSKSRFFHGFHPVYASMCLNYARECVEWGACVPMGPESGESLPRPTPGSDKTGVISSLEPVVKRLQGTARKEAQAHPEVDTSLDPDFGHDWQGYLCGRFVLIPQHEAYSGDDFLGNFPSADGASREATYTLIWTLRRTSVLGFKQAAIDSGGRAGVVAVYRLGPIDVEPFGAWLAWLRIGDHVILVDLQNNSAHATLESAVGALEWDEGVRTEEVFYAPQRGGDDAAAAGGGAAGGGGGSSGSKRGRP